MASDEDAAVKTIKALTMSVLRFFALEQVVRWLWRRAKNFGFEYRCPMCGAHLRAFIPAGERHAVLVELLIVGGGHRSSALCPVCYCLDRERLIYLYLRYRPHLLPKGAKLLHVAPEHKLSQWLSSKPKLNYITADLAADNVNLNFDLTKIPFAD